MNHKIGFDNRWEYYPEHGGIEWIDVLKTRLKNEGEPPPKAMWYQDADDPSMDFQLTQENTFIFLSRADDAHDLVEIYSPDGRYFGWFRDDIEENGFDALIGALQDNYCATVVLTMFPGIGTVEKFGQYALRDLTEYIPEDWNGEEPNK